MLVLKKKEIVACTLVVLIGVAGYLNWSYQDTVRVTDGEEYIQAGKRLGEAQYVELDSENVETVSKNSVDFDETVENLKTVFGIWGICPVVKLEDEGFEKLAEDVTAYVDKVYNILLEHGYNLEVTEIVFVGGGANVVKRFGNYDGNNIQYIEDVKANAKGYEYLGRLYLSTHKKEFGLG